MGPIAGESLVIDTSHVSFKSAPPTNVPDKNLNQLFRPKGASWISGEVLPLFLALQLLKCSWLVSR